MGTRITNTGAKNEKIVNTGAVEKRLDPAAVAAALGAEPVAETPLLGRDPITLHAVRTEIFRRLRSSGGRPALEGTTFRPKIPLGEQEWRELESIASAVTGEGCSPSPGQIASVLLNLALRSVLADLASAPALTKKQLRERLSAADAGS